MFCSFCWTACPTYIILQLSLRTASKMECTCKVCWNHLGIIFVSQEEICDYKAKQAQALVTHTNYRYKGIIHCIVICVTLPASAAIALHNHKISHQKISVPIFASDKYDLMGKNPEKTTRLRLGLKLIDKLISLTMIW